MPRPPTELNPEIPTAIERVVLRALEKKPERRFATAADFLRAVRKARGVEAEPAAFTPVQQVAAQAGAKGTGLLGEPTGELPHDSYHTQPIAAAAHAEPTACHVCGAAAEEDESVCVACGHELTSSPATAGLARRELTKRAGGQGLKLFAVSAALLMLLASLVYLVGSFGVTGPKREEAAAPARQSPTQAPEAATPTPATPARAEVAALTPSVRVDSSYDGYNAKPLTDGVTDVREIAAVRYNQGNWVSAESPEPHWIELDFRRPTLVTAAYVYWGFDKERYMPSRRVELQAREAGGGWRTVSTLEPGGNYDRAAFEFAPFVAERVRLFQPAQAGPQNRPFVMWVREVQVFGARE